MTKPVKKERKQFVKGFTIGDFFTEAQVNELKKALKSTEKGKTK